MIASRLGCDRRTKLVGLVLSRRAIRVRCAWHHSVVHAEFRHVCGGAGVSRSTASEDRKMVAQSRGHAQCEGSARCGVFLVDTISQREVRRCGFGEGKVGVVVGDDLAIVKVILSKVGFRSTGQSYLLLYPSRARAGSHVSQNVIIELENRGY